jgi:hypothetical protein
MPAPAHERVRRDRRLAGLVLCAVFGLLVWPIIFIAGDRGPSEASDQRNYHQPVISTMAEQWPRVDLVDYRSTTSPGYHLALAVVARTVTDNVIVLQLLSSLAGLGLVLAVWWRGAARRPWGALVAVLPLALSTYVVGGAIWLTTDNAALCFVALAAGGAVFLAPTAGRLARWGAYATGAVWIRQIHLWAVAPVWLAALAATALGRRLPGPLRAEDAPRPSGAWLAVPLLVAPVALVAWLAALWGGLTPPAYASLHNAGANPATLPIVLALFGAFGAWFLPVLTRSPRECLPTDGPALGACVAAAVVACLFATSWQKPERWGGWIWELVRRMPVVADRSVVLPLLAALGGLVLVRAHEACARAGRARSATVLALALLGWVLAQTMNSQCWQRYCEPVVLMGLAWYACLAMPAADDPDPRPWRRWWIGPLLLAAAQGGLIVVSLYAPVWRLITRE